MRVIFKTKNISSELCLIDVPFTERFEGCEGTTGWGVTIGNE